MDFYPEGDLIWLEADVLIRQQSQGHRSLDDFCKKFYGGEGGLPKVVPYTFDDVVAVLNEIAPLDWRQFFQTRVYAANPRAPLGGIEGAGWRLVFQETLPDMLKSIEAAHKLTDLSFSLGLTLRACLETTRGAAARDFGCGQGGEFRASPQRAVRNEPTPATDKSPAARRVFGEKAVWLRCSSVEDPPGIFSFVAPRHPAFSPKTAPLVVSKQALKEDGTIIDILPGSPADKAGISPAMKLVAVNGRRWTAAILRAAVTTAKSDAAPLELLVENEDYFKTCKLDYHDGEKYPHLERDATKPDLLTEILKPLTPPPSARAEKK